MFFFPLRFSSRDTLVSVVVVVVDRKNWTQSWTVLHGGILTFHKDPKSAPTGNAVRTRGALPGFNITELIKYHKSQIIPLINPQNYGGLNININNQMSQLINDESLNA